MKTPFLSLLTLAALAGCKPDPVDLIPPDPVREPRAITELTPDMLAVVDGNNDFAWEIYGPIAAPEDNAFYSPFSMSAALGMTYAGSRGETHDEMKSVLAVTIDDAPWHDSFGAIADDMSGNKGRGYEIAIANRVWGQDDWPWNPDFQGLLADEWHAPMQLSDIEADPAAAREEINSWVSDNTHDKIPELFPQGIINDKTRMVLVNAIYFQANWVDQFDTKDTRPSPFFKQGGAEISVDTMHKDGGEYAHVGDVGVLRLPYKDDELSLYLVLPDAMDGLPAVEAQLSAELADEWAEAVQLDEKLPIALPKFEIRQKANLNDALIGMGMPLAFDEDLGDFSGMVTEPRTLFIGHVIHEAWVKVDEVGTEAAAATGVTMQTDSASENLFYANHPFLFFVRDDITGSTLFIGKVGDPSRKPS